MSFSDASNHAVALRKKIGEMVFGQEDLVTETLCCLIAGGHILITGAPGLAKTTLVRVLASHLGLEFGRIQFTPDLLPSDIIGSEILNIDSQSGRRNFEFSQGPVFVNFLLADEINRASPRTQSALLEAMQERRVTVSGHVHTLPGPFMVFATQNPFESEGTFPLPEAQLDRFLVHSLVDYPDAQSEMRLLNEHAVDKLVGERHDDQPLVDEAQLDLEGVRMLNEQAKKVRIDDELISAIMELVRSTRPEDENCPDDIRDAVWYGAGPRAGISLISITRALALIEQQEAVRWEHVRRMAKPVLRHRIRLTAQASREFASEDVLVQKLINRIEERYANLAKGVA